MQYYKQRSLQVPALKWGINHEDTAREQYVEVMRHQHQSFECYPVGLVVNPEYPHLGASPDGAVSCLCCGSGLLEIKCPYKYKNHHPHDISDASFYLHRNGEHICLKETHDYYMQVQGQMAICQKDYSDFVCWTLKNLHIERILFDPSVFSRIKPSLIRFFQSVVLPELLTHAIHDGDSENQTYCICGGEEHGRMVACDNTQCTVEWFHYSFVGIMRKPRGKWYCPYCSKLSL